MLDPRIKHFEDNLKRDPIGHGCHVIRMRENSFRVIGHGDDSIYKEHQDKEYTGNILFQVDRSGKRHVVVPTKENLVSQETAPVVPGYVTSPWSGYVIQFIYIKFEIANFWYDNHYQWSVVDIGSIVRPPAWPMVQNDGVIFGDGRNNAPSYDPLLDIRATNGGTYTVPPDDVDILLLLSSSGAFAQVETFTTANAYFIGAATTNIFGFAEQAKWYYIMREATGTLYESA